jgi:CheY-like chemotaxis protein
MPNLPADHSRRSILVVDDSQMMRMLISALLLRFGYEVSLAHDGVEAVRKVSQRRYDCVLMDVDMPHMDGLRATEEIRRLTNSACHVPIIAVTSRSTPEDIAKCQAAGMNAHCGKPVKPLDLAHTLRRTLGAGASLHHMTATAAQ